MIFINNGCHNPIPEITSSQESIKFKVQSIHPFNTRAGYDAPTDITETDPGFGVYIVEESKSLVSSGNYADNHQIKWDGSKWFDVTEALGGEPMIWLPEAAIDVYAYCPFREIDNPKEFTLEIPEDQSTLENLKASDFLRAEVKGQSNRQGSTILLNFSHQLAKFIFTVKSEDPSITGKITSAMIHSLGVRGKYNLETGTNLGLNGVNDVNVYCYDQATNTTIIEAITIPYQFPSGIFLSIRTELNGITEFYPFYLNQSLNVQPNTIYHFNLSLQNNDQEKLIEATPVFIEKWLVTDRDDLILNPLI